MTRTSCELKVMVYLYLVLSSNYKDMDSKCRRIKLSFFSFLVKELSTTNLSINQVEHAKLSVPRLSLQTRTNAKSRTFFLSLRTKQDQPSPPPPQRMEGRLAKFKEKGEEGKALF